MRLYKSVVDFGWISIDSDEVRLMKQKYETSFFEKRT